MVRLQLLSPDALKSGKVSVEDVPDKLEDALALTVARAVNNHLRNARAAEEESARTSRKPVPDLAPHYAFAYTVGIVSDTVLHAVVTSLIDAGWKHSTLLQGSIVIARLPYDPGSGRGHRRSAGEVRASCAAG